MAINSDYFRFFILIFQKFSKSLILVSATDSTDQHVGLSTVIEFAFGSRRMRTLVFSLQSSCCWHSLSQYRYFISKVNY